jgi:flagellar hook assembly protein FlgD
MTPGTHVLRFYAEETSGVTGSVQTVTLYTATDMDTDREITNRPNPFNPRDGATMIMFRPNQTGVVNLTLYDLYGDVVYSDQIDVSAGELVQYPWQGVNGNGRVVANGGYICRIHGSGLDLRRKIGVVK